MRVFVYDNAGALLAEEPVDSAEEGWTRGTTICRDLTSPRNAIYGRGSG